jgi:hypothetical protein
MEVCNPNAMQQKWAGATCCKLSLLSIYIFWYYSTVNFVSKQNKANRNQVITHQFVSTPFSAFQKLTEMNIGLDQSSF